MRFPFILLDFGGSNLQLGVTCYSVSISEYGLSEGLRSSFQFCLLIVVDFGGCICLECNSETVSWLI